MATPMSEAALRYSRLGLAVIPLLPKSKRPMFENWPEVATSDRSMIERWWTQSPNANVGIATGQKSRVFVLDIDPKNGGTESLEELTDRFGRLPDTWQQVTGSGGTHYFFRYPNFRVGNATGILPGIDIRGDGGQVVAAPSIHPDTGNAYFWDGMTEIEQADLAEAPAWLLDKLQYRSRHHSTKLPIAIRIPNGLRNETMAALAGALRRTGLDAEEIMASMEAANRIRCEKPLDSSELRAITDSIMRYRPDDRNMYAVSGKLWRMLRAKEHEEEQRRERTAVDVVDGLSVYRSTASEVASVVDGLLYHGLTVFAGRPKVGKSWLTLQLTLDVALGRKFLGRDVLRSGGVVYLALEESQNRTTKRMRLLLEEESQQLQNITFVYKHKPLMQGGAEQLDELLSNQRPELVIADTFLALVSGGQKNEKRDVLRSDYAEIDALRKIAEKHATAFVLVHHMRKGMPGEGGVDAVAGSTGITAAADAIWSMKREDVAICSLNVVGRETEEQSFAMKFQSDPIRWEVIAQGAGVKDMKDEQEILELLRNEGSFQIRTIASKLKMNSNHVRRVVYRMYDQGALNRDHQGSYSVRVEPASEVNYAEDEN